MTKFSINQENKILTARNTSKFIEIDVILNNMNDKQQIELKLSKAKFCKLDKSIVFSTAFMHIYSNRIPHPEGDGK